MGALWKHIRHPLFRPFISWRASSRQTQQRERDQQKAKAHCDAAVSRLRFARWRSAFHEALRRHKSAAFHRRFLLNIAMCEWKRNHSQTRKAKQRMRIAAAFRDRQRVKAQMALWSAFASRMSALRSKGVLVSSAVRHRKMLRAMLRWARSAQILKQRRTRTWKSFEFRANRLKTQFFALWLRRFVVASSLRLRGAEFGALNRRRTAQRAFYSWVALFNHAVFRRERLDTLLTEVIAHRNISRFGSLSITASQIRASAMSSPKSLRIGSDAQSEGLSSRSD